MKKKINLKKTKILVLGAIFKENCFDLRNSGVINLISSLNKYNVKVFLHDPYLKKKPKKLDFGCRFKFLKKLKSNNFDCIIISVSHRYYKKMGILKIKKKQMTKIAYFLILKALSKKN